MLDTRIKSAYDSIIEGARERVVRRAGTETVGIK